MIAESAAVCHARAKAGKQTAGKAEQRLANLMTWTRLLFVAGALVLPCKVLADGLAPEATVIPVFLMR